MESNNSNNNNGGDGQQQLRRSARIRKLNKMANEEDKQAGGEVQPEPQGCSSSNKKKRREDRNELDLKIVQLPQENAEREIADETEEQVELPKPMKIQLAKETWFDMLAFLQRRQLGQIVPQIGDRRFARIAQSFLHNFGRITLANIYITGPRHRLIQQDVPIPENVKDFTFINLSFLNMSVINLLQKFKQNSLFGNVNLDLHKRDSSIQQTLTHVLPLIDNILSIQGQTILQLAALYYANNGMPHCGIMMARCLEILHEDFLLLSYETAFLSRWLHTPRDDGNARVLILTIDTKPVRGRSNDKIPLFIDGTIKQKFAKAKSPVSFFIRLYVGDDIEWQDISTENGVTKEKMVIKKVGPTVRVYQQTMALISRYPLGADKRWIEANEREVLDWQFDEQNGRICLGNPIRNAMDNDDSDGDDRRDGNGDDDVEEDGRADLGGRRSRYIYGDLRGFPRPLQTAKRGGGVAGRGRGQARGGGGGRGRIIGGGRR